MADQMNTPPTAPTTSLAPVERADPSQGIVTQNLDPSKGKVAVWVSWKPETAREKALAFNALTGNTKAIADMMGETIMLQNVIFQGVSLTNAITGEINDAVRVVLIDTDGKAYGCVSDGIRKAIVNLVGIVGMPPYPEGIPIVPRREKGKQGHFYTLDMGVPPADPAPAPAPKPDKSKPK